MVIVFYLCVLLVFCTCGALSEKYLMRDDEDES